MARLYAQSSNFTCGPAALLTAMLTVDAGSSFTIADEYLIWKTANTVFMGEGHPGCSAYGLGAAAIQRGYQADVLINYTDFDSSHDHVHRNELERRVYTQAERTMREEFTKLGGTLGRCDDGASALDYAVLGVSALLVLVAKPAATTYGHWVVVLGQQGGKVLIFDPYEPAVIKRRAAAPQSLHLLTTYTQPVDEFLRYAAYGPEAKRAYIRVYKALAHAAT